MSEYKVVLPAQAAAAADVTTVIEAVNAGQLVTEMVVIAPPGVTITGVNTNNFTITVRQIPSTTVAARPGRATGAAPAATPQVIGSLQVAAGVVLAGEQAVRIPITATSTRGNRFMLAHDAVLDVVLHQNGTGLAVPAGLIVEVETAAAP